MTQQRRQCSALVAALCAAVALCLLAPAASALSLTMGNSMGQDNKKLAELCQRAPNMKRISDMQQLIAQLKHSIKSMDANEWQRKINGSATLKWVDPLKVTSQSVLQVCLEQAESFVDLETILAEQDNVCKRSHIDALDAYHRKHLVVVAANSGGSSGDGAQVSAVVVTRRKQMLVKRFFKLYANQVAFTCKQNLLRSLRQAEEQFVPDKSLQRVMPWLKHMNGCASLDQQQQQQETEQAAAAADEEESIRCRATEALSSINDIHALVEAMRRGGDAEHQAGADLVQTISSTTDAADAGFILLIPNHMRPIVSQMMDSCARLERVYANTIMPIVRLAQNGYDPHYEAFDAKCAQEKLIQKWFAITLICNSLLSSRLADQDVQAELQKELAIVDDDGDESNNKPDVIVVDHRADEEARNCEAESELLRVMQNNIEDELWVAKYIPSKLNRITSDIVHKMMQKFKLDELLQNVVFRNRVKYARDVVIKLIFIGLALVGINAAI